MTEPSNRRPRGLNEIIEEMEVALNELKALRDADQGAAENARANMEAAKRRADFFVVPGLGGLVVLGRRFLHHPAAAAVAGGVGTLATGTLALAIFGDPFGGGPDRIVEPPPPLAAPPGVRSMPHVGPSKNSPSGTPASPQLGALPPPNVGEPAPAPSGTHPTAAPTTSSPGGGSPPTSIPTTATPTSAPTVVRDCRVRFPNVPVLRRGLLCGSPRL